MFFNHKLPTGQNNKSYDYENDTKNMQKPKNRQKSARRKCRSHLKPKRFSENFFYDPLEAIYKPIGTINIKIMWQDFKRNWKYKKIQKFVKKFWKLVLVASKS